MNNTNTVNKWNSLSLRLKADLMKLYVHNGVYNIDDIIKHYNKFQEGGDIISNDSIKQIIDNSNTDFAKRIKQGISRKSIVDWQDSTKIATHKLGYATTDNDVIIYPQVLNINDSLIDFTNPKYDKLDGYKSAIQRGDTIKVTNPKVAEEITTRYKDIYKFNNGGNLYGLGSWLKDKVNKTINLFNNDSTYNKTNYNINLIINPIDSLKEYNYLNVEEQILPEITKTYNVQKGDSLWKIANQNKITVNQLRELNPDVKGDLIFPNQQLILNKQRSTQLRDIKDIWKQEDEVNKNNLTAIQATNHDNNYAIIDKKEHTISVFDKDNNLLYKSDKISTGKSNEDYNTITYVDKYGKLKNYAGNNSTPAGITTITSIGTYHGLPSFTRGRTNLNGTVEDIASSIHSGNVNTKTNGCIRANDKTLKNLSLYLTIGTLIYTLPEKDGSKFTVKDGKLNFIADNPYGITEGSKKYWDDYNIHIDKQFSPLYIIPKTKSDNKEYSKNKSDFIHALSNNKENLQKQFNLDSDTYNHLALIALGIAEQESNFGTGTSLNLRHNYKFKTKHSDLISKYKELHGNGAVSRGYGQIKIKGDSENLLNIYKQLGINENTILSAEGSAKAILSRLAYMYNTEIKGKNFTGENNIPINKWDALLYKYNGRNSQLKNHTATPENNLYVLNIKSYMDDYDLYSVYANGGPLNIFENGGIIPFSSEDIKQREAFAKSVNERFNNNSYAKQPKEYWENRAKYKNNHAKLDSIRNTGKSKQIEQYNFNPNKYINEQPSSASIAMDAFVKTVNKDRQTLENAGKELYKISESDRKETIKNTKDKIDTVATLAELLSGGYILANKLGFMKNMFLSNGMYGIDLGQTIANGVGSIANLYQLNNAIQDKNTPDILLNSLTGGMDLLGTIGGSNVVRNAKWMTPALRHTLDNGLDRMGIAGALIDVASDGILPIYNTIANSIKSNKE